MSSPTPRANYVWETNGGDDILQIKNRLGSSLGGIDVTGAGFGALAGGGGIPGGSTTDIQSNDNGALYGDANFTRNKTTGVILVKTPAATAVADADFTFAGAGSGSGPNVVKIVSNDDSPWQLWLGNDLAPSSNITFFVGSNAQNFISFAGPNGAGDISYRDSITNGHPAGSFLLEGSANAHFSTTNDLVPEFASGVSVGTASFPWLNGVFSGSLKAATYNTATNAASTASPAVCGSAASGVVQVAASATTLQINTTAVTVNSRIHLTFSVAGITAPVNIASLIPPYVSIINPGVSFTITLPVAPTTNPVNVFYVIVN